jgi:hypothetical protein
VSSRCKCGSPPLLTVHPNGLVPPSAGVAVAPRRLARTWSRRARRIPTGGEWVVADGSARFSRRDRAAGDGGGGGEIDGTPMLRFGVGGVGDGGWSREETKSGKRAASITSHIQRRDERHVALTPRQKRGLGYADRWMKPVKISVSMDASLGPTGAQYVTGTGGQEGRAAVNACPVVKADSVWGGLGQSPLLPSPPVRRRG